MDVSETKLNVSLTVNEFDFIQKMRSCNFKVNFYQGNNIYTFQPFGTGSVSVALTKSQFLGMLDLFNIENQG